jgi:hypothetical protein
LDTRSKFDAENYQLEEWKFAFRPESNHYQRIGLDPERQYSTQEIDEAYQSRFNWWRERQKQRDKGQENNPLIKRVGPYIDDALKYLGQASACLLDADKKGAYDRSLEKSRSEGKEAKLLGFIAFTLRDALLTTTEKRDLLEQARELGITRQRAEQLIWEEMAKCGAREVSDEEVISHAASQGGARRAERAKPPRLVLNQTSFPLGTLRKGEKRECKFATDNHGGGMLQGNIELSDPGWLKVSPSEITGHENHQDITVFVDTSRLDLGSNYAGIVYVHSNGGKSVVRIDLSVELEKAAVSRFSKSLFWLGVFLGAAFGYGLHTIIPNAAIDMYVALLAGSVASIMAIAMGAKMGRWGGAIGGFFLAAFAAGILRATSMVAYTVGAWATIYAGMLYLCARSLLVGKHARKSGALVGVSIGTVGLSAAIVAGGVALTKISPPPTGATPIVEDLDGIVKVGRASGIVFKPALNGKGAVFTRANSSHIEYPSGISREGTLEFVVNIASGYYYQDYNLRSNQSCAQLFTTDVQGGDVTWPGSTWFSVCGNGDVRLEMGTQKGSNVHQALKAIGTQFRFNEWHSIGMSYGSNGQAIMVDGKLVASDPTHRQMLGVGGDHSRPKDVPTIGESVSGFWARHRYEGGFEGMVRRFRASAKQDDWVLSAQSAIGGNPEKPEEVRLPPEVVSAADTQAINELLSEWTGSLRTRNLESQMNCYAPHLEHYFKKVDVERDVVRADKELALSRYSTLEVHLADVHITPQAADRVLVELKKTWSFARDSGAPFAGQGEEQLVVTKGSAGWVIVSELEVQAAAGAGPDGNSPSSNPVPDAIKSILDRDYPGWTPALSSDDDIQRCKQPNSAFQYWFVWGDFDGDGIRDYAAEITQTGNVSVIVFLSRDEGFQSQIIDRFANPKRGWGVLGVADKGTTILDLSEGSNGALNAQKRKLDTDALLGIGCETSAVAYIYSRSGTFERVFVQD